MIAAGGDGSLPASDAPPGGLFGEGAEGPL